MTTRLHVRPTPTREAGSVNAQCESMRDERRRDAEPTSTYIDEGAADAESDQGQGLALGLRQP